ncbi:ABC transporter ATP-binding protein [Sideroxydans lithotrophicus]|uniref:Spermidine/putrescine import ATP-binding protein PotA n=1 Tax=Sideroxydans lithotrophicus (strain ES-1) TaxID=580332 RepID=D5CR44_SIDLE|nr:ABC transporter ATP-binding protein [Sideroxydans lithotrophicus]ADE11430.1 spermidine/putrescine ABC transporter ATPase subunit [Sideroxydans lithotrophicus ES-1]
MALLELRNVTRRFGDFTAVENVSLSIEAGEFFTLLGPSGCGKTTILRMIAGFEFPDAGQILLDGRDLAGTPAENRPIHTVFQSYALFPHLTVAENISFPLRMAHHNATDIRQRLDEAVELVRLTGKAGKYPHELSGGQQQRVALARALINRPRLLLLDESLGALDAKLREEMQVELINLQRDVGITFVFVTHAQAEALALSHRIAVMNRGKVEQVDEPARLYSSPRNRFVADFIGHITTMEAQVVAAAGHSHLHLSVQGLGEIVTPLQKGVAAGDRGVFAIRPEQVRIGMQADLDELKNHFSGEVHSLLYQGDVSVYRIKLPNGKIVEALLPNSAPGRAELFRVGTAIKVGWRHDAGVFLHE